MRTRTYDLDGLLELPHIRDAASRRASFRQGLANLARAAAVDGPSPLEGIAPDALVRSVKSAFDGALFEDLDWLSPTAVAVALYELAAALPAGTEKRELGRRVVARLNEGSAEVFAAVATRMALGTRKGLTGAGIRARVALLFSARGGAVDAGPLAFAFCSRRELAREWIAQPSTGSLPARRLAARMLERAAVAAARRASQGDDFAPRVFATDQIGGALARLLADREPLVWRHAAVARGILAGISPPHWKSVVDALHPRLTPTEWRRGAVSMVAAIATSPERALLRARDLVKGALAMRDPGLAATMVWGLPRVLDAEPEAGEQLLDDIVDVDAAGAAEGIAAIVRDVGGEAGRRAVATARAVLADRIAKQGSGLGSGLGSGEDDDEGELLIARALEQELSSERGADGTLRDTVARAVAAWVEKGSRDAHAISLEALELARVGLSTLEGLDDQGPSSSNRGSAIARRTSVLLLRDLDAGLLEESSLGDLLQLRPALSALRGPPTGKPKPVEGPAAIDELHDRLGRWLLTEEERSSGTGPGAIAMSGRRLRALLHLVDAEGAPITEAGDEGEHGTRVRARRLEAINVLIARLAADGRTPLHRTICATLARALDALVRDGTCEPVDIMLVTAAGTSPSDIETLGEASMDPDVCLTLRAYAAFVQTIEGEEPVLLGKPPPSLASSEFPPPSLFTDEGPVLSKEAQRIEALLDFSASLGNDGTGRADALRAVLGRIGRALRQMDAATSRKSLADASGTGIDALAGAVHAFAQMEQGAMLRVLGDDVAPASTMVIAAAGRLAMLLSRIAEPADADAKAGVDEARAEIGRLLPPALVRLVGEVLERALALPYEGEAPPVALTRLAQELPAWLGPRRTIGGFYIVRPLGAGAAASVFVAKRAEERHEHDAELFALKVPDYDGAAARSLSEQEFLEFFRAEASALLGLPPDPNLARFVTFDLGARPKPILVMELIEGPTLERFVSASDGAPTKQTAERALAILDGVLAGLEVMHRHVIGHLDVKPSNVILREGKTPTLVDFGLAGRHVRPGCATGPYGAPEVWGVLPEGFVGEPSPLPADVYAFGALAFEVLTGNALFDADTEVAIISKHLTHDGHPEALDRLAAVRPIVELIEHSLRHDPRNRWTVPQLRAALRAITPHVKNLPWPLGRA